ncbi:gamma-glutamyl kinase [Puniceibacterium confluentis]|uniref:gamma-glutamyl kinase n=1 Tax=Puniceibacterium confluentis TaxID=1958944 RepID=UPI0011B4CB40|nr:gamma-glutamyl kinase [Puniceibacterium confluentis]
MLVFWKQRLVFLAVPKTGTTAYETALAPHASVSVLDPPELKHAPVYRYNRFFRPMFEKMGAGQMDVIAVIREPVSWLGSWYRYRQRPFLDGKPTSTRDLSFDAFVEAYTRGDQPAFANVGSQSKFVEPRPNGTGVTHLFQYENQAALVAFLEDRLKVRLDLPRSNVSLSAPLSLSPRIDARLRRKNADDFALWSAAGQLSC